MYNIDIVESKIQWRPSKKINTGANVANTKLSDHPSNTH